MSIIYCEKCHKYIDTDVDAEHEEEEHDDDYMQYINNEVNQMNNK